MTSWDEWLPAKRVRALGRLRQGIKEGNMALVLSRCLLRQEGGRQTGEGAKATTFLSMHAHLHTFTRTARAATHRARRL